MTRGTTLALGLMFAELAHAAPDATAPAAAASEPAVDVASADDGAVPLREAGAIQIGLHSFVDFTAGSYGLGTGIWLSPRVGYFATERLELTLSLDLGGNLAPVFPGSDMVMGYIGTCWTVNAGGRVHFSRERGSFYTGLTVGAGELSWQPGYTATVSMGRVLPIGRKVGLDIGGRLAGVYVPEPGYVPDSGYAQLAFGVGLVARDGQD